MLLDDSMSLAEVLLLVSLEIGAGENELSSWLGSVGISPGMSTVSNMKKTIQTEAWQSVPLPPGVKKHLASMLGIVPYSNNNNNHSSLSSSYVSKPRNNTISVGSAFDFPDKDVPKATKEMKKQRHRSEISPEVLMILNGQQDSTTIIDFDEIPHGTIIIIIIIFDNIIFIYKYLFLLDITHDIRELNMEIRFVGEGLLKNEVVYTRGVGESTLNIDELEWTIRVLDAQVCLKSHDAKSILG